MTLLIQQPPPKTEAQPPRDAAPDAAHAAAWGDKPPERRMRLIAFRQVIRGSLRGFASVELPIGLTVIDCPVCVSHGKSWASLPSKPQIDRDGQQKRDANGKPTYVPVLRWRDRDLSDRWSAAVVALVRQAHPDALDDTGAP